ncbi:substrate-binding periplasmic protein [Roseateles sp. BYS78W]|uniref:Substrate-binding periplasmic protein n=1 Tax=Pelomonas candidula TaxID=3299025 RepID=A0ABW7HGL7_9BURK
MKRRHCLAACAALAGQARGQGLRPLAIGFDEGSLPTMYRAGAQPAARGIYPALVGLAFAALGRPCELRALPFKRLLADVDGGQLLAGAVIRTPEREQRWLFSQAYFLERLSVYSAGVPFRGLADLTGKRVGVIRGWSYGEAFDAARRLGDFHCEEVSADEHNFAKLLRGRLDYVVATELGGRMLLELPAFERRIASGAAALGVTPIHLALPRSHEGGAALLAAFNTAVEQLQRDGQVEPLVAREIAAAAELVRGRGGVASIA